MDQLTGTPVAPGLELAEKHLPWSQLLTQGVMISEDFVYTVRESI